MKKHKIFAVALIIFVLSMIFCGCGSNTINDSYALIRIHIRADSNEKAAQDVKLLVRDSVTEYLSSELKGVTDFDTAYEMLSARLKRIEEIADEVLRSSGFSYSSRARLNNEFFPTRSYEGLVVESGYYDALILELGSGKGDNWWCVVYPPLCYLEAEGSGKVQYKSYIAELIKKYFK